MLSDPFSTTYQGSMQAGMSLGQGLQQAAGDYAANVEKQKQMKATHDLLKKFGVAKDVNIDPSSKELEDNLRNVGKQAGITNVNFGSDWEKRDEKSKQEILKQLHQMYGVPVPKSKTDIEYDFSKLPAGSDISFPEAGGNVNIKSSKTGLFNSIQEAPEGFEIVGYDQKGNPMIRKTKVDVPAEKLKMEKEEKELKNKQQADFIKSSAQETLDTINEVEKGMDYFGLTGQIPSIPGTDRANWESNVNKLMSGKVIDLIMEMKNASKTGATGFGNLTEKELKVLQDTSTALKRSLSKEDAKRYINKMKESINKVLSDNNKSDETTNLIKTTGLEPKQKVDYKSKYGLD